MFKIHTSWKAEKFLPFVETSRKDTQYVSKGPEVLTIQKVVNTLTTETKKAGPKTSKGVGGRRIWSYLEETK